MAVLPCLHRFLLRTKLKRRVLTPYILLLVYSFGGAVLFYAVESNFTQFLDHRASAQVKCISTPSSAMYFAISACSTIGFGVIYPCTATGRALAVLYIFLGIPLLLLVLADIGSRTCDLMRWLVIRFDELKTYLTHSRQTPSLPYKPPPWVDFDLVRIDIEMKAQREREIKHQDGVDVPIWLGVSLTLLCFLLLSVYHAYSEDHPWWEAIYSASLTYLAGDYNVANFDAAAPAYVLVLVGFAMLSTTISIIRNNMDNLMRRVQREVQDRIAALHERGISDVEGDLAQQILDDVMRSQSRRGFGASLLTSTIPQRSMQQTSALVDAVATATNLQTQLEKTWDVECASLGIDCKLNMLLSRNVGCDALRGWDMGCARESASQTETLEYADVACDALTGDEKGCLEIGIDCLDLIPVEDAACDAITKETENSSCQTGIEDFDANRISLTENCAQTDSAAVVDQETSTEISTLNTTSDKILKFLHLEKAKLHKQNSVDHKKALGVFNHTQESIEEQSPPRKPSLLTHQASQSLMNVHGMNNSMRKKFEAKQNNGAAPMLMANYYKQPQNGAAK